jgi:hypothetical protein
MSFITSQILLVGTTTSQALTSTGSKIEIIVWIVLVTTPDTPAGKGNAGKQDGATYTAYDTADDLLRRGGQASATGAVAGAA